jgi:hypothetical protein
MNRHSSRDEELWSDSDSLLIFCPGGSIFRIIAKPEQVYPESAPGEQGLYRLRKNSSL